jgi:hypothetical protein
MCHGQGHTLVHSLGDVLLAVTLDSRHNLEIRLTEAQEVRAFMSRRVFEPVASCVGFFSLPKIDATSLVISRACSFTRKKEGKLEHCPRDHAEIRKKKQARCSEPRKRRDA